MNRAVFLLALLATFGFTGASAETVWVDDTLRVGVRNNPGNTETPIEVITSGAGLEVLERTEGYLRVRTASGAQGWVSTVYVTDKPPARLQLEEAKKENARLQAQLRALQGGTPAVQAASQVAPEMEELRKENARLAARIKEMEADTPRTRWSAIGGGIVLLFGTGMFLGVRRERQRVSRRFNGLQI